jgi:multiple sugar transport system ATP-binding protein
MAEVLLENLGKRYEGGAWAVERVNLRVADGEFLVLVGPSGCGKSTTLRMIAGLEDVTSGSVSIGGRRVDGEPPKDRDIAMVFQNYALYPHMTVYDNLAFALKLRRVARAEIEARVREAAEILGLGELLHRLPKQLSGGQRQRVAVGRAIVRKPKVFLFDEPLSNLDARMRAEMRGEISRLHRRLGATMVYVTHDQVEAMTMGDRVVVMDRGRVQQAAQPLEMYRRPANLFVAGFIGTPPMNLLRGHFAPDANGELRFVYGRGDALSAAAGVCGAWERLAGRETVVGFRPEALRVADGRGGCTVCGTVDRVEPMGAESFVHLVTGGGAKLVARLGPECAFKPGATVTLALDLGQAHYFDGATGLRVARDGQTTEESGT